MNKSRLLYPGGSIATQTLTISFYSRANEGEGSYGSCPHVAALAIVFPTGINNAVDVTTICGVIKDHILNSALPSWWRPVSGSIADAIDDALSDFRPRTSTTCSHTMFFDGQFGSLSVGT
jgi:hypothetical protein